MSMGRALLPAPNKNAPDVRGRRPAAPLEPLTSKSAIVVINEGCLIRKQIMIRSLVLGVALLGVWAVPVGCEDESSSMAQDLGVQEGRRPVPEGEARRPPGPPTDGAAFQTREEEAAPSGDDEN